MDAGDNPSNNGGVKVWSCGDFPQQQWTQMQNQGTVQTGNSEPSLFHSTLPHVYYRLFHVYPLHTNMP
jgi:hypothetical protein